MVCRLGGQAFLTGTEPELFADLGERAQWFVLREGPAGSELSEGSSA
jgi:DNA replication and repair protein RecF